MTVFRHLASRLALLGALGIAVLPAFASCARAAEAAPQMSIHAVAMPTNLAPEEEGSLVLLGTNVGAAPTDGSPITVTDTLPPGIAFLGVGEWSRSWAEREEVGMPSCSETEPSTVTCTASGDVMPGDSEAGFALQLLIEPEAGAGEGAFTNSVRIGGGGGSTSTATDTAPIVVTSQPAPAGLASFLFSATDAAGKSSAQAGAHPNLLVSGFDANSYFPLGGAQLERARAVDVPKDVVIEFPLGFLGNPRAAAGCPAELVVRENGEGCPPASYLGVSLFSPEWPSYMSSTSETAVQSYVHNTIPSGGFPAELGLGKNNIPAPVYSNLVHTPAGYVIRTVSPGIPRAAELKSIILALLGNPDAHNGVEPQIPFFTMPADCSAAGLHASIHVDFWHHPAPLPVKPDGSLDFEAANFNDPQWSNGEVPFPTPAGCNALHFEPNQASFEARPTTNVADSPSGLDVNLEIPQPEEMETPSTPPLKDAVITLPRGIAVNPSSADGLEGCTEAQIELDRTKPGNCPDASKLGEVELQTPLLGERNEAGESTGLRTLHGSMFLGTPECAPCGNVDAEAGRLVRLYLEINDPLTGTFIKVPGTASLDPQSGQVKADFPDQPQLPFSDLKVKLKEGPRAPLTTPQTCGSYETTSELTPWSAPESGPPAEPKDHYAIESGPNGQPCHNTESEEPNSPRFEAGSQSTQAGAFSPFVLKLSREDGTQRLTDLNVTLPPGLTAKLAGVGECSDAAIEAAKQTSAAQQILSPSCPLSSEVGTVDVAAGSGPTPFHVGGHAYLAGPYKGASLSLAVITPAKAGPFDLGTVVVHSPLYLNPETAQATVKSGPLPTILAGVPLDIRQITVVVSRHNFTLNPTNCEKLAVTGEALSTQSQAASLSNPFQVGGCKSLKFKPKLSLSLKGKTARAAHPALKAVLRMKGGEANIARAQVTLPHAEFLDQGHLNNICTRVQFSAGNVPGERCPAASIYGHAKAITPLLDKPLEGNVYLRSSSHKLPDLVAALNGQINIALDGKVDTGRTGGIRNTFEVVPDAPVSKFTLEMKGGSKGLLQNSEDICAHPQRAIAHFVGQNGKVDDFRPVLRVKCPKAKKGRGHHKH